MSAPDLNPTQLRSYEYTMLGLTGAPILLDALSYVEARVTGCLDNDENTIFVGDVVAAEQLRRGGRLSVGEAWPKLGTEWVEHYERNHLAQINHSRTMRGLPVQINGGH